MSYHLKYLKYKKKYLNLKTELEGGMMQPSAEYESRLEEGETKCLFNKDMTEGNFMEILEDIAECDDEVILKSNPKNSEGFYGKLENRIESYFNFIKARQYIDVPEHARPHLDLIASKLPARFFGVQSAIVAFQDAEAVYNSIIKTRIDFLKSYGKLAFIEDLKDELYEEYKENDKQKATIEQLTTDLQTQQDSFQIQQDSFRRQQDASQTQINDLQVQQRQEIDQIKRDADNRIGAVEIEKDQLETQLRNEIRLAKEKTEKAEEKNRLIRELAKAGSEMILERDEVIEDLNLTYGQKIKEKDEEIASIRIQSDQDIEYLKSTHEQKIAELEDQIRKQEEEKEDLRRQLESDRVKIEEQNKEIDKLIRAQYTLEQLLISMNKTITSKEYMNMQLQSEKEKLEQDKLKLELSRLEIKDDNGKLQDSIIALQESNKDLEKELLEAKEANKDLNIVIQQLDEKIVKMDKEKTKEIAKLTMEYVIARKKAKMEFDDLFENLEKEKNEEINDLKDQVKSKDNTILKIRTKVNNNLSKLIQNMIDTIEPKTYKQPPLFMI